MQMTEAALNEVFPSPTMRCSPLHVNDVAAALFGRKASALLNTRNKLIAASPERPMPRWAGRLIRKRRLGALDEESGP